MFFGIVWHWTLFGIATAPWMLRLGWGYLWIAWLLILVGHSLHLRGKCLHVLTLEVRLSCRSWPCKAGMVTRKSYE
jgi:hypothetical protein